MAGLSPARQIRGALLSPLALAALAVLLSATAIGGQLSYSRGQTISPAYEGWEEDAEGNRYFLFGYMNRNWLEELDVPVGPENFLTPGEPDQGQPTTSCPAATASSFESPSPEASARATS